MADGKSVREICEAEGMPTRQTFNDWRKRTPELEAQYAAARIDREDSIFDDIQYIADHEPDPKVAKVKIDAREWTLARMNGKKYGNKIDATLGNPDGSNLQIEIVRFGEQK